MDPFYLGVLRLKFGLSVVLVLVVVPLSNVTVLCVPRAIGKHVTGLSSCSSSCVIIIGCQLGTGHHRTSSSRLVIIYNPEKEQSRIHWRGRIRKSLVTKYTLLIHFGMFERLRPPFLRELIFESLAKPAHWVAPIREALWSSRIDMPEWKSGCLDPRTLSKFEISSKKLEKWLSPKTFWNAPPIILDEPGYFLACSILKGSKKNFGKFWNSESGHGILCFS